MPDIPAPGVRPSEIAHVAQLRFWLASTYVISALLVVAAVVWKAQFIEGYDTRPLFEIVGHLYAAPLSIIAGGAVISMNRAREEQATSGISIVFLIAIAYNVLVVSAFGLHATSVWNDAHANAGPGFSQEKLSDVSRWLALVGNSGVGVSLFFFFQKPRIS